MADKIPRTMDSFKPNSHKSKAEKEKHVEKVVQGQVQTRKKSPGRKFAETFLSDDIENVKGYLLFDVVVPTIKDTISNVISSGVDMLLFGESRGGGSHKDRGPYVSYSSYYNKKEKRQTSERSRNRHDFRDIILDSRGEAEEVLSNMVDILYDFGEVSVADLYDLCGISNSNWTDNKYGWTDLSGASVKRARGGGYLIDLPRAEQIN